MTGIKQSPHNCQTGQEIFYAYMPCSGEAEFDRSERRKGVCAQPESLSFFFANVKRQEHSWVVPSYLKS